MAETWPEGVPYVSLEDSGDIEAPFRPRLRTDMEDGTVLHRRSTSLRIATINEVIMMSHAEFLIFDDWVRRILVDGSLRFTKEVWKAGSMVTKTCSFADEPPYRARPRGPSHYQVVYKLDVRDY